MQTRETQSSGFQPQTTPKANSFAPRPFEVTYPGQDLTASPTNPFPRRPHEVSMGESVAAPKPATNPEIQAEPEPKAERSGWLQFSLHAPDQPPPDPPKWNGIQAKLTIGQPNDPYEQEADRVAEQVMNMAPPATPNVQRNNPSIAFSQHDFDSTNSSDFSSNHQIQKNTENSEPILCKKASETLLNFKPNENTVKGWQTTSKSFEMPTQVVDNWSTALGKSIPSIKVHTDQMANLVAMAHDAEAVTIGQDIYVSQDAQTPGLLAHEVTHAVQSNLPGTHAPKQEREQEAEAVRKAALEGKPVSIQLPGSPAEPMNHPAARILLRTGRWLLTRTTRTISRHIARHGRRIARRAVHSIFRNPRKINYLVSRTVREATEIARNAATHGADDVIEQGGVRIFRQVSRTPGKYRIVVEKVFGSAIGTRGERILRVVIDMSGRIVTAFPTDRFLAIGLSAGAVTAFTEGTAEASERVHSRIEAEENQPVDWIGEAIDLLNPIAGGIAGEGEALMLDIDQIVEETTFNVIQEIEEAEQICLDQEQRQAVEEMVRAAIGTGMSQEEAEGE